MSKFSDILHLSLEKQILKGDNDMILCENPLRTVAELRHSSELDIDTEQSNRYCIRLNTAYGKEAYYFSSPIYNAYSLKLIRKIFTEDATGYSYEGSSCSVSVTETHISLRKGDRNFSLLFHRRQLWKESDGELRSEDLSVYPTNNGICLKGRTENLRFGYFSHFKYRKVRRSHNCLCWMEDKFRPVVVVSALCAEGHRRTVPLTIGAEKSAADKGQLYFETTDPLCPEGWVEVDFYEPKLIQDTPVSGKLPKENNAFGPVSFIGKSPFFGTQWLYTRLDTAKMPELKGKYIREMKLYVPCLSECAAAPELYGLKARFCSFGSNWSNRIGQTEATGRTTIEGSYICIDLTGSYTDRARLTESVGTVLIPAHSPEGAGCCVIATGDCFTLPPILCVKY